MKKPVKVLHVIYALSGGGAERQLQLLLKYAQPNSVHGVLCVETRDVSLVNSDVEVFVHQRRGKFDFGIYLTCYRTIKTFQPDVIHLWLPPVVTIPAMLIAVIQNKPVIFSYRRRMFFYRFMSVVEYFISLFAVKKVISNNTIFQSAKYYQFLYLHKTGVTIPNGLDFSVIQQKNDHEVKTNKPVNMLFVGRLVDEKNILNLIRALSEISKEKGWNLDIFGEGELKQDALDLTDRLGLTKKIVFHGFETSIYSKLAVSDLLLMPSNTEGMPNVLVEALATKIPVLASKIPSILDIVGDTGAVILVDPQNVNSITKGIESYIDNQSKFIKNTSLGFDISKKFDVQLMSKKYHDEYNKILNSK